MTQSSKANVIYSFAASHKPVAELASGETLVVETADCFNGQIHSEEQDLNQVDYANGNPATGPFYINCASPGDALIVEILDIKLAEQGVLALGPGQGILGGKLRKRTARVLKLQGNSARFNDEISIPLQPMLGVIGVAPATDAISTTHPGTHGGNLDCRELRPGNKIILPVFHSGALLALGDVHAAMGDGELSGCALEAAAEVKIRLELLPEQAPEHPQIITEAGTLILVSAPTLEGAVKTATEQAVKHLSATDNLSFTEAYMLAGAICNLGISQVVNPLVTVKIFIPRLA